MTYYLKNLKCQLQVFILQQLLIFSFPLHFPRKNQIENNIQHNSKTGCHRRCQSDFCKACMRLYTHNIGKRQSYQQCLDESLDHHPYRFFIAIKETYHAE